MEKLKIYEVDRAYTDYLRRFDDRVPEEKTHAKAKTRKYVGVLFEINTHKYFAPLSSPKDINADPDKGYQNIVKRQAIFIRKNRDSILQIAKELYVLMTEDNADFISERARLEKRCCRFKLLEEKSQLYTNSSSVVKTI